MSEQDISNWGEKEEDFEAPETLSRVYEYRGEAAGLAASAKERPEEYAREVEQPFMVEAKGLTTLDGRPAKRASILLKSPGCSKRRGNAEANEYPNCAFCVFSENYSTGGNPVTPEQYEKQMIAAMETLQPSFELEAENSINIIELFNSGSFFSDSEISNEAREKIIAVVRENSPKNIVLAVESKFVDLIQSLDKLDEVLAWLNSDGGTRRLEVGFGLETTDQIVGEQMKKNIKPEVLSELVEQLAERNVRSYFYVLLKPGLMSERFAIDSATASAIQIAEISKSLNLQDEIKPHISLGPTRIYRDSLLHAFKGYKAPKYWSVTEVIKRLAESKIDGEESAFKYLSLHVGLSGEGISIVTGGSPKTGNEYCHKTIEEILKKFNHKMNIPAFLEEYAELVAWEKTMQECTCYDQWEKSLNQIPVETINTTDEIILSEQLKGVMKTEEQAWPEEVRAPREKFESRAKIFPQGFILGYESGIIAGVSTSQIFNFEPTDDIESWEQITSNGFITPTANGGHNPDGNSLYVVSLGVRTQYKGRGIGKTLIEAQKELVKKLNLKYLFLGSRVPGFQDAKNANPDLTIEDYVAQADSTGKYADPDIGFYKSRKLEIARIKENYMEDDPESENYGVIMCWENQEYIQKGE